MTKKEPKKSRHHCFPKKSKRHLEEIKVIDDLAHRRWHLLVQDKLPEEAVRYIARNFLPKELEERILTAMR